MTKLKNTKKGMAKKALSISLVAAMLATSNVPVWAAEFSDGEVAAFTSEVEAPVVEEEVAPVVETAEEIVTLAEADEVKVDFTLTENGWGYYQVLKDIKLQGITESDGSVNYQWKVNDNVKKEGTLTLSDLKTTTGSWKYIPTSSDLGGELQLILTRDASEVYIDGIDPMKFTTKSNKVVISRRDIGKNLGAAENCTNIVVTQKTGTEAPYYDGKSHDNANDWVNEITFGGTDELVYTKGDFIVDVDTDKDFVNADSSLTLRIKPKDVSLYCGEYITAITSKIQPRAWKNGDNTKNLKAELIKTEYEYTGEKITPAAEDVKISDVLSNTQLDSKKVVDNIWTDSTDATETVPGTYSVGLSLKEEKLVNYNTAPTVNDALIAGKVVVKPRKLENLNIVFNELLANETGNTITDADLKYVKFASVTRKEDNKAINLTIEDIDITNIQANTGLPGVYTATVTAKSTSTKFTGSTNVTFNVHKRALDGDFDGKLADGTTAYATAAEEYTGEEVKKDITKLGKYMMNGTSLEPNLSYSTEFKYANNVNAGVNGSKASFTVKGLGEYAGAEQTFEFAINPAKVTASDITYNEKVVFVDDTSKKPESYDLGIVVNAKNANDKVFTLEKDKDYTVTYSYKNATDGNKLGNSVVANIKITNTNFTGNGDTFSVESVISKKQIDSLFIKTEKESYTYTGEAIVPALIVKDGDIELEQDIDYKIRAIANGTNVGTAVVTIEGKGDYDSTSTITTSFKITPANVADLTVDVKDQNYDGHKLKPVPSSIKLGNVTIKDKFTITYPTSKDANKEVGTGTLTLTPDGSNKNFTGSKEVTFNIVGKVIENATEENLKVYDALGNEIVGNQSFLYNGKEHTFAKAEFDYSYKDSETNKLVKLVEGKDFEIKYYHNVYGNDEHKAYIAVVGKGNYAGDGTHTFVDEDGKTVNAIIYKEFTVTPVVLDVQNVTVKNGEYAEGMPVKPVVTVTYGRDSLTLVEGEDYELTYPTHTEPTETSKYTVKVKGIHGYTNSTELDGKTFNWGIDKKDLANCDIEAYNDNAGLHVVVMNGSVRVQSAKYVVTENTDGTVTVTPAKDSKYYTGSKTVKVGGEDIEAVPETPMITDVQVVGNKATVILSGESDGATGYDYVISKDRNCITNKDYDKVNKNILATNTTFTYTQQGNYWAYCHAWKRVDGKKVFSDWSNAYPFSVSAITPDQPAVTKVSVKGSTVTVTYTKSKDATGYDLVLGSAVKKVNGELRPVDYGTLVKKVYNGNTVTATFKNVKKGTYHVGLHAYNRTSEDGKKVFSPWSNTKKVTVK